MHLAIVRRGQYGTFDLLQRGFRDNPHVQVIWDRRMAPRRTEATAVSFERRRSDRRRNPAVNWNEFQYAFLPLDGSRNPVVRQCDALESIVRSRDLDADLECAAIFDVPVLVSGGDDRARRQIAEFVHDRSDRRRGPFVVSTEQLQQSLATAHNGTLYLPELKQLTKDHQEQLLQYFAQQADREHPATDVRIVSGTGDDLRETLHGGHVLPGLFYCLNALRVTLPSDPA